METPLKTILTIAGSDCIAGAGIQADIKAAAACGVYAMTAVTAVTAQNSSGIKAVHPVDSDLLIAQLDAVFNDVRPDAIKIGMVGSPENAAAIAGFIRRNALEIPMVIDPVATVTAGGDLSSNLSELREIYLDQLFPLATCVTPNIPEALSFLPAMSESFPLCPDSFGRIAESLLNLFNSSGIILKGGHADDTSLTDTLAYHPSDDTTEILQLSHKRIDSINLHGTGCVFSSILAAALTRRSSLPVVFRQASDSLNRIIAASATHRLGKSTYGPLTPLGVGWPH